MVDAKMTAAVVVALEVTADPKSAEEDVIQEEDLIIAVAEDTLSRSGSSHSRSCYKKCHKKSHTKS